MKDVYRDSVDRMRRLPTSIEQAVSGLSDAQLETPYGDGKWTIRQVVHHLVDAHINGYVRIRLVLTEENPTLKTYDQEAWAELSDAKSMSIEPSLIAIRGIHERFCALLESLVDSDMDSTASHPEVGQVTLGGLIQVYADHGDNHLGQIMKLKREKGW